MKFKVSARNIVETLTLSMFIIAGPVSITRAASPVPIRVSDFLPDGYVTGGQISYQSQLQGAIDSASSSGGEVIFEPMTYLISDPSGLRVHSNLLLKMEGATFLFDSKCSVDGQLFLGHDVENVSFRGGKIVGRNDVWVDGVNIRGIYLVGECKNIRIRDMNIQDLSSNGVGVFAADAEHPAKDIRVIDSIIDNCCNKYGDYRAEKNRGPEKGSVREDQGLVALYHVHDFSVRGCRLEDSRSDGTHFYFCNRGQFSDNYVYRAKMGGYFLESCQYVIASNNIIRDNGSRGVTIERGSQFCTLRGNTISGSGREGLWIPDSLRCVISDNIFSFNGRKPNGDSRNTIWNANITINQAKGDKLATPTAHYVISNNIIETDQHQVAAIRVDTRTETENIVIQGNLMVGDNRRILIEGLDQEEVVCQLNPHSHIDRVTDDE